MQANEQLRRLLADANLSVTDLVRHVYRVEDEHGRVLVANRSSHIGRIEGDFYLGWELLADCWWGCDLWDNDVLELARETVSQYTGIEVRPEDIEIAGAFEGTSQGSPFLHVVYRARLADSSAFDFWGESHDEARWLEPREAAQLVACDEDRAVIGQGSG